MATQSGPAASSWPIAGSLKLGALLENPRFSSGLVDTPGEIHLLMTGRVGSRHPPTVSVCGTRSEESDHCGSPCGYEDQEPPFHCDFPWLRAGSHNVMAVARL